MEKKRNGTLYTKLTGDFLGGSFGVLTDFCGILMVGILPGINLYPLPAAHEIKSFKVFLYLYINVKKKICIHKVASRLLG
jgi:hypothetical protein